MALQATPLLANERESTTLSTNLVAAGSRGVTHTTNYPADYLAHRRHRRHDLDDEIDQPAGDHDNLARGGTSQECLDLFVGQNGGFQRFLVGVGGHTTRPRTLPFTCTGYSTVSSTR